MYLCEYATAQLYKLIIIVVGLLPNLTKSLLVYYFVSINQTLVQLVNVNVGSIYSLLKLN